MINLPPFIRQALAENRNSLALLAALKATTGLLTVLGAFCTAHILATVIDGSFSMQKAVPLFEGLLFVVLGRSVLTLPTQRVQHRWMLKVEERMRQRIHASLLARSPLALVPETGGELQGIACESVRRLDSAFETVLPALIELSVLVPLYLIVFALTDTWTALLAFITLPIAPFLLYLIGLVTKEQSAKEYRAMMRMGKTFAELLRAIPMMKLFCREHAERERVAVASDRFRTAALAVLRTAFVSSFALELITTLSIALIAVSLGLRLVAGGIDFEPAFFLLLLAPEFYAPLAKGGTSFHAGMEASEAWRAIQSFLASATNDSTDKKHPAFVCEDTLSFSNVACAYPGRTAPAVHDITFDVPRGKITLLRGTSGAGKSTIFALALGFLQPNTGMIRRPQAIAYVPQEPYVFAATLRENLLLGRAADDRVLHHALEQAGLRSLFERMPEGFDTVLGEGGRALSAGERRRLGLARALVAPADVVLLDEVTAGLDEENERIVLQTIQKLRNASWQPSILIASHREATLEIADNMLTLDGGTPCRSLPNHISKLNASVSQITPPPLGEVAPKGSERVAFNEYCNLLERDTKLVHALPSPPRIRSAPPPRGEALGTCDSPSSCSDGFHFKVKNFFFLHLLPIPSTFLALLSALLADASSVLLLGASAWLIATASFHPHLYLLAVAITAVRASGIGRAVFRYLDRYLSHRAVFTLLTRLRLAVYDLACARLPERRPGASSGTFLQEATTGVDEWRDFYLRALFPFVRIGIIVIATSLFVAQEQASLAALPFFCTLVLVITACLSRTSGHESANEARYRSHLLDVFAGRTEAAAFAARTFFTKQLDDAAQAITMARTRALRREDLADTISEALPSLAWLVMFFVLAGRLPDTLTQTDGVHLAVAVMVLQTLMGFVAPLTEVVRKWKMHFSIAPAEVQPCELKCRTGDSPHPSGPSPLGEGGWITRADSIFFSYDSSFVFSNLSFSLHPAEKLLLLGESGAGKTTLFHLLTRLWEADAGSFSLYGQSYESLSIEDVRTAFAAATQAGYVFSGSIRENFERLLPETTDELRQRALSIACCDEFIRTLPQGIATPLGEDGVRLSGGQRQRLLVALAVCALLADPQKILLLDEPTTGLDHVTAGRLLQNLMGAFPTQAMILILHDHELAERILLRDDARAIMLTST